MRPSLDAFRPFGLISRARPVTSKSNPLINVILKKRKNKSNTCRSTETSTDELLLCLAGQVDKLVDWLHIHWEISLHTDLKKQIKRCIYSLAPCLCNAITLEASALTIHKVGAGRPLIDVSSKSMPTNFHSISLRSKPGLLQSYIGSVGFVFSFFKDNVNEWVTFACDGTGPADESKRTKRVQGWSCLNWLGGILIIVSWHIHLINC